MNLESKWLEDFSALAATRSFSQAAEKRFVTQPAFSRRIRSLEGMLGLTLVNRARTPIELTEAGQLEELKNYLCQYESELSEERPTLCANPAVDALAGHYDHEAHSLGVPVDWRLELPRQLPVPEADLCMMLGNLLENAFHASQKLPPEQRQVKVMARMLSPAMLGLLV